MGQGKETRVVEERQPQHCHGSQKVSENLESRAWPWICTLNYPGHMPDIHVTVKYTLHDTINTVRKNTYVKKEDNIST